MNILSNKYAQLAFCLSVAAGIVILSSYLILVVSEELTGTTWKDADSPLIVRLAAYSVFMVLTLPAHIFATIAALFAQRKLNTLKAHIIYVLAFVLCCESFLFGLKTFTFALIFSASYASLSYLICQRITKPKTNI